MAENTEDIGLEINLDEGEGQILSGNVCDDIRFVCPQLIVSFECPERLTLSAKDGTHYIRYFNINWSPLSFVEVYTQQETWRYDATLLPNNAFTFVDSGLKNFNMVANKLKCDITGSNLLIEFPMINLYSAELLQAYRKRSMDKAYLERNMGNSLFVYFNSNILVCSTWGQIVSDTALNLETESEIQGCDTIKNIDQTMENYYSNNKVWEPWSQQDYLMRLMGDFVQIEGPSPFSFGRTYTIKFSDNTYFDKDTSYFCVRSERDLIDPNKFVTVLGKILNMKKYTVKEQEV